MKRNASMQHYFNCPAIREERAYDALRNYLTYFDTKIPLLTFLGMNQHKYIKWKKNAASTSTPFNQAQNLKPINTQEPRLAYLLNEFQG